MAELFWTRFCRSPQGKLAVIEPCAARCQSIKHRHDHAIAQHGQLDAVRVKLSTPAIIMAKMRSSSSDSARTA